MVKQSVVRTLSRIEDEVSRETPDKDSILKNIQQDGKYKIEHFVAQGCWGSVYKGIHLDTGQEVAIKLFDPQDIALRQMVVRKLSEEDAMKKNSLKMAACRNIVPNHLERDSKGRPFIVMPFYEQFLHDILKEKQNSKERSLTWEGGKLVPLEYTPSGLRLEEILKIGDDLSEGICEFQTVYRRAHCDIKPDNIAYDSDLQRCLISDTGTATYVSATTPNRNNMGCIYTRPLKLFLENEHPDKQTDVYAFGSLLFKLFTGKYPFEEELDEAAKSPDGFGRIAARFYDNQSGIHIEHTGEYQKFVKQKLAEADISPPLKELINSCLVGIIPNVGCCINR